MAVLVTAASRHGGTSGIADAIGAALRARGVAADVRPLAEIDDVTGYDAVVVGSGVYMGQWLEAARAFVGRHGADLATRPTWLFSSGPLGDPPKPAGDDAVKVDTIMATTGAREHRIFAGRLDKRGLGLGERAVARMVKAPAGDFRDWDDIAAWGEHIADALT